MKNIDFFSSNELEIPITMKGFPTMTFFMMEVLNEDAKVLRQKHIGLTKDAQETAQHSYNTKMLAALITKKPENPLPGMPEMTDENFVEVLTKFFADVKGDASTAKKQDFLANVFGLYWRAVQPEEFFRG